jgi:hypothetical protein
VQAKIALADPQAADAEQECAVKELTPFEVRNVGLWEIRVVVNGEEAIELEPGETLLTHRVTFYAGQVRIVAREGWRVDLAPVDDVAEGATAPEASERTIERDLAAEREAPSAAALTENNRPDSKTDLVVARQIVIIGTAILTWFTFKVFIEGVWSAPDPDQTVRLVFALITAWAWFALWQGTTDWRQTWLPLAGTTVTLAMVGLWFAGIFELHARFKDVSWYVSTVVGVIWTAVLLAASVGAAWVWNAIGRHLHPVSGD